MYETLGGVGVAEYDEDVGEAGAIGRAYAAGENQVWEA